MSDAIGGCLGVIFEQDHKDQDAVQGEHLVNASTRLWKRNFDGTLHAIVLLLQV